MEYNIPTEIKEKLYIYLDVNSCWKPLSYFDFELTSTDKVLLHVIDLDIKLPHKSIEELKGQVVLGLRNKKEKLIDEHLVEVAKIDEKINQLLAIEYQPIKEVDDGTISTSEGTT